MPIGAGIVALPSTGITRFDAVYAGAAGPIPA
jgi:hypothetical protein